MVSLSLWLLVVIVFAATVLGVVTGFAITCACRLGRSHQRILASRDSFSRLLLRRASETDLLTRSAGLEDPGLADAVRAYIQDRGDQLTTDGLDRRTAAQCQGNRAEVATCSERVPALSRAIRETLIPDERARIALDPQASARLEVLNAMCYRIEPTRNTHNVDVVGVRVLRSARMVKLLRLVGHAPIPESTDFDGGTRTDERGY